MLTNKSFINTLNFGYVPIRKTHTLGETMETIYLADNGTNEYAADIKYDYNTHQPFAVLLDEDLKPIINE